MELTIEKVFLSKDIIEKLGKQKMNAVTAYKIQKNISALNFELSKFSDSVELIKQKFYVEHSNLDELAKAEIDFNKELIEISKIPFNIDIQKIKIDEIKECELTPFEIMSIEWMIE